MADVVVIRRYLTEINNLADEIQRVPNLPQDLWTMKGIDKKARRIRELCGQIRYALGTGDGGSPDTGRGGTY